MRNHICCGWKSNGRIRNSPVCFIKDYKKNDIDGFSRDYYFDCGTGFGGWQSSGNAGLSAAAGNVLAGVCYPILAWVAVLVSSVLFGLLHIIGNELDFLSTIRLLAVGSMVGILFSLVTYESGSIFSSPWMHGVWNMVTVGGILNIGREPDEASVVVYLGFAVIAY